MSRITLSVYCSDDREWLSILLNEEMVRRYLSNLTTDVDLFVNEMELAESSGLGKFWIIRLDNKGIGFISIYDLTENPFIFYAMLPKYRNKGYMKKSIEMIENVYSFSLSTIVDINNVQSLRILTNTAINTNEITNQIDIKYNDRTGTN